MIETKTFNKIIYARAYFLFWNPIVNKIVGINDEEAFGDINRSRLLLIMLNELFKTPSSTL